MDLILLLCFCWFFFLYFFKSKKCITSDTLNVEKEIIGNDLTKIFLNLSSKKDFLLFLDSNKNISKTFFEVIERNNNNNLNQQKTDELYLLLSNQYYDSVYSSLQKDFPDISKILVFLSISILPELSTAIILLFSIKISPFSKILLPFIVIT
mgnify:FL=1